VCDEVALKMPSLLLFNGSASFEENPNVAVRTVIEENESVVGTNPRNYSPMTIVLRLRIKMVDAMLQLETTNLDPNLYM
ncbi:hypothetical protein TNIN_348881, partial [Trichonephila inaurata madagascariensis]